MEPPVRLEQSIRTANRSAWRRWSLALLRIGLIAVGASLLTRVPLPVLDDWLPVKNVIIAAVAVGLIGKTLFDTLFYDHFWP